MYSMTANDMPRQSPAILGVYFRSVAEFIADKVRPLYSLVTAVRTRASLKAIIADVLCEFEAEETRLQNAYLGWKKICDVDYLRDLRKGVLEPMTRMNKTLVNLLELTSERLTEEQKARMNAMIASSAERIRWVEALPKPFTQEYIEELECRRNSDEPFMTREELLKLAGQ